MDSHKITIGFSNIKLMLIEKCRLDIQPNELQLWFSCIDDVVYAHDNEKHENCIAIATSKGGRWTCRLKPHSLESNLFFHAVTFVRPGWPIEDSLNDLYSSNGFIPVRS